MERKGKDIQCCIMAKQRIQTTKNKQTNARGSKRKKKQKRKRKGIKEN